MSVNDPKYENAFVANNITIREPSDYTICEEHGRLEQAIFKSAVVLPIQPKAELKHDYKTIKVPPIPAPQQSAAPPPAYVPSTNKYVAAYRGLVETWEQVDGRLREWGQYPERFSDALYEYIRYFLAEKNLLNVAKRGQLASDRALGLARAFACNPYLPRVAVAQQDTVALYDIPFSPTVPPKVLWHEHMKDINCISFRPNMGNSMAVGCREGIALWTTKNKPRLQPHLWEGYHHPTSSWVVFLRNAKLGAVSSISWDPTGSAETGRVAVWQISDKQCTILSHVGPVELVLWGPRNFLLTSHAGELLEFWDNSFQKQIMTKMPCQAAAFSPDGKFLAVATKHVYVFSLTPGTREIAKVALIEPFAHIGVLPDGTKADMQLIECLAWSPDGERLGISFSGLPMIALYAVSQLNQTLTLSPVGYVNPISLSDYSAEHIQSISFMPNFERGALLCTCYTSGVVAFTPLYYQPTTSSGKAPIPIVHPSLFAQPPVDLSPIGPPTSSFSSPNPAPSPIPGPIFSPIPSPSYRVLFNRDNARSPGFAIGQ